MSTTTIPAHVTRAESSPEPTPRAMSPEALGLVQASGPTMPPRGRRKQAAPKGGATSEAEDSRPRLPELPVATLNPALAPFYSSRPPGGPLEVHVLAWCCAVANQLRRVGDADWLRFIAEEWRECSARERRALVFGFITGWELCARFNQTRTASPFQAQYFADAIEREMNALVFPSSEMEDNRMVQWLRQRVQVAGLERYGFVGRSEYILSSELSAAWCQDNKESPSHPLSIELSTAMSMTFASSIRAGDLKKSTRLGEGRSKAGWIGCKLRKRSAVASTRGGLEGSGGVSPAPTPSE